MTRIAGVDGCRAGWLAVVASVSVQGAPRVEEALVVARLDALLARHRDLAVVAVDMPIGLDERAARGGRECDRLARSLLRGRASSIFSPPCRAALAASSYRAACRANARSSDAALALSKQSFFLFPRMRELDALVTRARQRVVREAHPELAFQRLAGAPLPPKRTEAGERRRRALLAAAGLDVVAPADRGWRADDLLDATVLVLTAARIARGRAERIPPRPPRDARGRFKEIWL